MATTSTRFKLKRQTREAYRRLKSPELPRIPENYVDAVQCTLEFIAVTSTAPANNDNLRAFRGVPTGTITLQDIDPAAWPNLEPGRTYKVNFTPVD